jgi:hypothetical protein
VTKIIGSSWPISGPVSRGSPEMAEEPAKFIEYARACREMVARMPDAQAKQKLLELAEAGEELAREAREPT